MCYEDDHWLHRLSNLADIFHHVNQLNKSLQGSSENILTSRDKILAFKRKINLWKNQVAKGNLKTILLLLELKSEIKLN